MIFGAESAVLEYFGQFFEKFVLKDAIKIDYLGLTINFRILIIFIKFEAMTLAFINANEYLLESCVSESLNSCTYSIIWDKWLHFMEFISNIYIFVMGSLS